MKFLNKIWYILCAFFYLVGVATWITYPEYLILNLAIMSIPTVILGFLLWPNREYLYLKATTRYSKKLYSHSLNIFLVSCILFLGQYLLYKNSYFWDLTQDKKFTLPDQSREALKAMKGPVEFIFFSKRANWDRSLPDLRLYQHAKTDLTLSAYDIDTNPTLVKANNIEKDSTLLIKYRGVNKLVYPTNHLNITNALLKLLRNKEIKVYLTKGHDEVEPSLESREGASQLVSYIQNSSYQVGLVDLMKAGVPPDAYALVVLGPRKAFHEKEIKLLEAFIEKGGKLLVTLGPEFKGFPHGNLKKLFAKYGLKVRNNIIVDMLSRNYNADATVPIINQFDEKHPITRGFKGRIFFPLTTSVELADAADEVKASLLAFSNQFPASWAESDLKGVIKGTAKFDKKDAKGPQAVLGISEYKHAKLALFGNTSFIINAYKDQGHNFNLFLNTLSWLVDDEPITSFNRPDVGNQVILMSDGQVQLIFYFSVVFLPLVLFGFAIFLYKRKQHL